MTPLVYDGFPLVGDQAPGGDESVGAQVATPHRPAGTRNDGQGATDG